MCSDIRISSRRSATCWPGSRGPADRPEGSHGHVTVVSTQPDIPRAVTRVAVRRRGHARKYQEGELDASMPLKERASP